MNFSPLGVFQGFRMDLAGKLQICPFTFRGSDVYSFIVSLLLIGKKRHLQREEKVTKNTAASFPAS